MDMTFDQFIGFSVALTGYSKDVLHPARDTQKVGDDLYAELFKPENKIPAGLVNKLANFWDSIAAMAPLYQTVAINQYYVSYPDEARLAQNIILMWYVGVWYDLAKNPNSFDAPNNDHVVSALAYTNGLVWGEMGAHPMGFSNGVYGYWEQKPSLPAIS